MESVCRFIPSRGRAALLATACLLVPAFAADTSGLYDRELNKRYQGVEEAQELLSKGDQAYLDARYSEAVEAFSGARDLIPAVPATQALRDATTRRYAQASVAYGQELVRKGDLPGAHKVVDKVLAKNVAPTDPDAVQFKNQLNDPIRTNPAMTAEHGKNIDQVRKLLYTAEGAFNLGKYDQAKSTFESVLRIDPANSAARRGMEKIAAAKTDYQRAAFDHTRAEMLGQVEGAWETPIPALDANIPVVADEPAANTRVLISQKIKSIILPAINLDQVTLEESVDFIRAQASSLDTTELDPTRKGLNINIDLGAPGNEVGERVRAQRFNLRLKNVPISTALKYICDTTRTTFTTDDFSVIIRPAGAVSSEMVTRTFKVAPDFLTSAGEAAGTSGSGAAPDPFATQPTNEGLLPKRRGAMEILKASGVGFPEGSMATFNPGTNTLIVRNTAPNLDMVSQVVEALTQTQPVQVVVTVTMIKTEERRMKELGFDWLLNDFGLGGAGGVPGVDALNISGGTRGNGGDLSDIPLPLGTLDQRPITAGNRSGDEAISGDSIDDLIANTTNGFSPKSRAPGILGVTGFVNSTTFQGVMRGLSQKKGIDLMAKPSVVCRSGVQSTIHVVREFIYPTEYEPPELPNSVGDVDDGNGNGNGNGGGGNQSFSPVTPSNPSAFEKRDVGIVLDVLPTVSADKRYVELQMKPVITDFDGFVNFGSPINSVSQGGGLGGLALNPAPVTLTQNAILMPVFSTMRINSPNLTVADGATVVIGGLLQERNQKVDDKTPVLGNLPLVGRFFQSNANAPVKKAVVFMVSVKLVDPTGRPIHPQP